MQSGLELRHLHKRYGDVVALDDMGFVVPPGQIFGFVGSNGAGKTTAMRIVLGVLAADSGEVLIDGAPITLESRRRIGYMPEERGLYPKMRVGEQLVYLARLHGVDAAGAERRALKWAERLGIQSRFRDPVEALSLGNQQRVQLAAALVHDPLVMVLDEPFSGLDPLAVNVMSEVLAHRAAEGVPVLFSSHQLDLIERLCDRVGVVKAGRLVAHGTVEELQDADERRLVVETPVPAAQWLDGLAGVRLESEHGTRRTLVLDRGVDDQTVLHAALDHGPVHSFARQHRPLTEVFRHVVTADRESAG